MPPSKLEVVVCPTCNGTGKTEQTTDWDSVIEAACPRCHGNLGYRCLKYKDPVTGYTRYSKLE